LHFSAFDRIGHDPFRWIKASYTGYAYSSIAALAITTAAIDTAIADLRTITAPAIQTFLNYIQ
jgi:hypothetical protein